MNIREENSGFKMHLVRNKTNLYSLEKLNFGNMLYPGVPGHKKKTFMF